MDGEGTDLGSGERSGRISRLAELMGRLEQELPAKESCGDPVSAMGGTSVAVASEARRLLEEIRTQVQAFDADYQHAITKGRRFQEGNEILRGIVRDTNQLLEAKIEELSLLRLVGDLAGASVRCADAYRLILETIMKLVQAENGSIFLFDRATGELTLRHARGSKDNAPHSCQFRLGQGVAGYVAETRKMMNVPDVRKESRFEPSEVSDSEIGSLVCLPLANEGALIGVLNLSHPKPDFFKDNAIRILQIISQQVAVALDNTCLLETAQDASQCDPSAADPFCSRFAALSRCVPFGIVAHLLNAAGELEDMGDWLKLVAREIECHANPRTAFVLWKSQEGDAAQVRALKLSSADLRIPPKVSLSETRLGTEDPVPNPMPVALDSESAYAEDRWLCEDGNSRALFIPLIWRHRPMGLIALGLEDGMEFDNQRQEVLQTCAALVALILQKGQLEERLRDTRHTLESIPFSIDELEQFQQQMIQSERLASMGKVAAGVAHEINNPLQAIRNFVNRVLSTAELETTHQEYLQLAVEGIDRMAEIVQELLELHRDDEVKPEITNLRDVLKLVSVFVRNEYSDKQLEFSLRLPEEGLIVRASSRRSFQVLLNLLLNAADAVDEGGQIEVEGEYVGNEGVLRVSDDGPGVAPEDLPKVMEPFFTTKEKGTGLGLAVCNALMKAQGGKIELSSGIDCGTIVTLRFPRG